MAFISLSVNRGKYKKNPMERLHSSNMRAKFVGVMI